MCKNIESIYIFVTYYYNLPHDSTIFCMTKQGEANKTKLTDFDFVGEGHFSFDDMLHLAYLEGQKDFQKDLIKKLERGLQTSAGFSSLYREKLKDLEIEVEDMFLKILNFDEFECLVLLSDKDYYEKSKRWVAYNISRELNESIGDINILFSLMPHSDKVEQDKITSEGFHFKYDGKQL